MDAPRNRCYNVTIQARPDWATQHIPGRQSQPPITRPGMASYPDENHQEEGEMKRRPFTLCSLWLAISLLWFSPWPGPRYVSSPRAQKPRAMKSTGLRSIRDLGAHTAGAGQEPRGCSFASRVPPFAKKRTTNTSAAGHPPILPIRCPLPLHGVIDTRRNGCYNAYIKARPALAAPNIGGRRPAPPSARPGMAPFDLYAVFYGHAQDLTNRTNKRISRRREK
jgi:hypothetical protein